MPFSRSPSYAVYSGLGLPRVKRRCRKRGVLCALLLLLAALVFGTLYLRALVAGTARAQARDTVTRAVSEAVRLSIAESGCGYGDFVSLEKDGSGTITAVTTDTMRVNLLAQDVLCRVMDAAEGGKLDICIPLGDLFGSGMLLGRGPEIPVKVSMMTASSVRFENALTATGINQSRHTLTLVAEVWIDLFIPWGSMQTTVESEVLIAETVLLGRVPDTYISLEG
ncbi:MAG: hypothetical protein LUC21_02730 [Oscillospiraceae bacterium]|nr:hypothetical protein [Oscillospiraceae bacterium]